MIVKSHSRRYNTVDKKVKTAVPAPIVRKSEKPQPKVQIEKKSEVKPVVKTES